MKEHLTSLPKWNFLLASKFALLGAVALAATGCTDASVAAMKNLGNPAVVKVYSGGKLIHAGISTRKMMNEAKFDGYYFNDKCEGDTLVEVVGDIVITRPDPLPSCESIRTKM